MPTSGAGSTLRPWPPVMASAGTLNKVAAEVCAVVGGVHAATDVTGFGLAGHAQEMARGSGVSLHIDAAALPQLPQALAMYERGVSTGVNAEHHEVVDAVTRFDRELSPAMGELLVDPQTSGGLLVAVDHAQAESPYHLVFF